MLRLCVPKGHFGTLKQSYELELKSQDTEGENRRGRIRYVSKVFLAGLSHTY